MDLQELCIHIVWVVGFAALYTFLDKKYKWFRIEPLYREKVWQNFLINLAMLSVLYAIFTLILG